jgi:hypothetical protein
MGRGARRFFAVIAITLSVLAAASFAGAIVVAVLPLPAPAAQGTCGPGKGSEPAISAFFDPGSIGAGREPTGTGVEPTVERLDWLAFVGECQASTNGRMLAALALVLAGVVLLAFSRLMLRVRRDHHRVVGAPSAWQASTGEPESWQWWQGGSWGQRSPPAETGG